MYHIFIHSSVRGHLDCFYVLAVLNNDAMSIEMHVSFQVMVFSGYMPRSGIAGSYGSSVFRFKDLLLFWISKVFSSSPLKMSLHSVKKKKDVTPLSSYLFNHEKSAVILRLFLYM